MPPKIDTNAAADGDTSNGTSSNTNTFASNNENTISMFVGNIEPFHIDDDFTMYYERFEKLMSLNNILSDGNKLKYFVTFVGADTYNILSSLTAPNSATRLAYDETINLLKNHFKPEENVIVERFKFNKRFQLANENLAEFLLKLKALSKTCDFGSFLNDALRDRFVAGITNKKVQVRLLNERELTFENASRIAQSMELAEAEVRKINERGQNYINQKGRSASITHKLNGIAQQQMKNVRTSRDRCYATKFRPRRSESRSNKFRKTCYRCHQKGHFARECINYR